MTETSQPSTERHSHPPMWLVEGLDVVEQRRPAFIAVTLGVVVIGGILAMLAPGLVPPTPLVGAAVGLAAVLLGVAVAVALDATDLRLRGPRHVGAAGGELVAVLPTEAEHDGATTLAAAVLEARDPASPLLLGLAASGRDVRPTVAWTDALASALVAEGVSVLRIDLASGHTRSPGLLEVVRDGVKLASVVTFGPEPKLARLGAGEDLNAAIAALTALPGRLPRDLDVLLVALPTAASQPVVTAVQSLDHVLIVAQRDRTSRVELIAGLDALEAAGTRAQVALLDDRTAARLARRKPEGVADTGAEPDDEAEIARGDDPDVATSTDADADAGPLDDELAGAGDPMMPIVESPGEVGPEVAQTDPQPSPTMGSGSSESSPETVEEDDLAAEDGPSPASGEEAPGRAETPRGPQAGGAFGVGGAALTAAEIAATVGDRSSGPETPGPETPAPDEEPDGPEEVHGSPHDPTSEPEASPSPGQQNGRKAILGLDADDHENAFGHGDAHSQPIDEWLSWDDTPREPRAPHDRAEPEPSEPRPVDVVQGAAEAAAIALVRFPVEPSFDSVDSDTEVEGALPVGTDAAVASPVASVLPPAPVDLGSVVTDVDDADSDDADSDDADVDDADPQRADEVPSGGSQPELSEPDAVREEMLRTTAQLSVLSDDLDGDERPLDTP